MHDPVGDRMKELERAAARAPIPPEHAIYARIDGRGFSAFTRDMQRPFDPRMTAAMRATATFLLETTHADAAYVQSDEISLIFGPAITRDGKPGQHFFGGKPDKLIGIFAGAASSAFMKALIRDSEGLAAWADRVPHFDARVVGMEKVEDAVEAIAWRGQDARRNGIRQLASAHFSHRELQFCGNREVIIMLARKGIPIADQPKASMNGTLLTRALVERHLTDEERLAIPEAHRPDPETPVQRHQTVAYSAQHPGRIENLHRVIFASAEPKIRTYSVPAPA